MKRDPNNLTLLKEGLAISRTLSDEGACCLVVDPSLQPKLYEEVKDRLWFETANFRHFELMSLRGKLEIDLKLSKKKTLLLIMEKLTNLQSFSIDLEKAIDSVKRETKILLQDYHIVSCFKAIHLLRKIPLQDQRTKKVRFVWKYQGLGGFPLHRVFMLVAPQPPKKEDQLTLFYPKGRLRINGVDCKASDEKHSPKDLAKLLFRDRNNLVDYEFNLEDDKFMFGYGMVYLELL